MKEIAEKAQEIFNQQDQSYSRIIREYATVKDIPGNQELARQYIQEMKEATFNQIQELAGEEPEEEGNELIAGIGKEKVAEYSGIIPLIQAEIGGADDRELSGLIERYAGTEYDALFRILLKPRLKALRESGPEKARIANDLSRKLAPALDNGTLQRKQFLSDIRTLLFFGNGKSITVGIRQNQDGRFLLGNGERRSIEADLAQASVDFSPTGKSSDPLIKTKTIGGKMIREIEYLHRWNQ